MTHTALLALALGLEHLPRRHPGHAHHLVHILCGAVDVAGADRQRYPPALQLVFIAQGVLQFIMPPQEGLYIAVREYLELVATQGVYGLITEYIPDTLSYEAQQPVSVGVAEVIIVVVEIIQIDDGADHGGAGKLTHALPYQARVPAPGILIVCLIPLQLFLYGHISPIVRAPGSSVNEKARVATFASLLEWSQRDLNSRPPACHAGALPTAPWPQQRYYITDGPKKLPPFFYNCSDPVIFLSTLKEIS